MPCSRSWFYRIAHAATAVITVLLPTTVVVVATDAILLVSDLNGKRASKGKTLRSPSRS